jgi:transposase
MPRRIKIEAHLGVKELESRYRAAKNPVERSHYQIIWLLAQGKTTTEVAAVTGYSRDWIWKLVRRYNSDGAEGLADRRCQYRGAKPLLDDLQQALLWQALCSPPADGGLWNSRKVADWMAELLERPVDIQRGWDYLRQMELRRLYPRLAHLEADPMEQEAWKKKLAQKVKQVQQQHPQSVVDVWTMDEHRLGLKPVLRRVWTMRGFQPIARVHWRYQWLWLYGFVHPETGETYFWILPRVNITLFNQVLADFAQEFNIGQDKQVILVLDQAGWHTSEQVKLQLPQGLHLEFLPSHSPELQPAERLWPLTNESIANRCFESLDELEEWRFQRCQVLLTQRESIRRITCYHWWPTTAN